LEAESEGSYKSVNLFTYPWLS